MKCADIKNITQFIRLLRCITFEVECGIMGYVTDSGLDWPSLEGERGGERERDRERERERERE